MASNRGLLRSMLKVNSKVRSGMDIRHIFDFGVTVSQGSNWPPDEPWARVAASLELKPSQVSCWSCFQHTLTGARDQRGKSLCSGGSRRAVV